MNLILKTVFISSVTPGVAVSNFSSNELWNSSKFWLKNKQIQLNRTCFFPDDMVYMPEERLLEEYILSDVGKIWTGPVGSHRGREWIFGQFDACILPAAWVMLETSELEHSR